MNTERVSPTNVTVYVEIKFLQHTHTTFSVKQNNQLNVVRETIALFWENYKKYVSALCGKNAGSFVVTPHGK